MRMPWDKFEVALLIEAHLQIQKCPEKKKTILQALSNGLRQKAINDGLIIDETYRNLNGMMWQEQYIKKAFEHSGFGEHLPSKSFQEMVLLYLNDNDGYNAILKEAKRMVEKPQDESHGSFQTWLEQHYPNKNNTEILNAITYIDDFGLKTKVLSSSLYHVTETSDLDVIRKRILGHKFFTIKYRKSLAYAQLAIRLYSEYLNVNSNGKAMHQALTTTETHAPVEHHTAIEKIQHDEKTVLPDKENRKNEIRVLLTEKYPYGFRIDSIIELNKFKQFASESRITLPDNDEELRNCIILSGILVADKVYFVSDPMLKGLQSIIESIISKGIRVFFYESLISLHQSWMDENHISSEDILKKLLQTQYRDFYYGKNFAAIDGRKTEHEAIVDELKRVWGEEIVLNYEQMKERLLYIPVEDIKYTVAASRYFVYVTTESYFYIDNLKITEAEAERIRNYVEQACVTVGFASLSDIPLGNIKEENYSLTDNAIWQSVFNRVLFDIYYVNGKIITKTKSDLDAPALLKRYCSDKDSCSFTEASDYITQLNGSQNRQYVFKGLYDSMIRVDENEFVADKLMHFDVECIDSILDKFISDGFTAIRNITTFALFPLCGYSWNHYLLESFCYRFSKKYSLRVLNFNDKHAGIIAKKQVDLKYNDMLAIVAAKSKMDLTPDTIGVYFFETGYLAKSKYSALQEIVDRALSIRMEN